MNKTAAWLLILCLLLSGVSAWAEDTAGESAEELAESSSANQEDPARVAVNLQAIKVMLDANDMAFTYHEDADSFEVSYRLNCPMEYCTVWLTSYEDGVWIQADYDAKMPEESWAELLRFCSLCNESMRLGCFYLDRETQTVGYKFFVYSDVVAPTQKALSFATGVALVMLEYRGRGVAALLNDGATADQAMEMIPAS